MALTICRWKQLNEFGKTHWKANVERKKDVSLQLLSKQLEKDEIDLDTFLELCSKGMHHHFNSIEKQLDEDLDEWINDNMK